MNAYAHTHISQFSNIFTQATFSPQARGSSANLFSQELQGCKRSQALDMMAEAVCLLGGSHHSLAVKGLGTQEYEVIAQVK